MPEGQGSALDVVLIDVDCLNFTTSLLQFVARENTLRSRGFVVYFGEVKNRDIYDSSALLRTNSVRSFLKLVHIKDDELKPITAVPHAVKTDFYAEFVGSLGTTVPTSSDSI
jgi:hypothetical protein